MADAAFARARQVFDGALTRPPDARGAFLDEACRGDAALRREVESLLAAHERASGFLSGTPLVQTSGREDAADPLPRTRPIGPYRILGVIARGGMGTVYRAVRDDDAFQKTVALKLVQGGAASEFVERRFRQERQILARLQHPNIATILDGGATEEGQPYLVMEHVGGKPITTYCDEVGLGLRPRLALFGTVCAAVQYAHQNLVVHRDLKPGNILVTPDGTPKLLDFGIAKLLAAGVDPDTAPTATLLPMMTPEYASPEQVRGEAVTTASDVYSLGVLLYELLAGRRPYAVKSDSMEEIVRAVCQTAPPLPSAVRPAGARGRSELRGDLDTIVMKALRKEPARRYASVQELAEDLRRYLEGRPVLARPDTLRYRASKFMGRHRWGVSAATAIVLALVGGLAATARQARIAERERALAQRRSQDVRRLANSLIFELHDKIRNLAGATDAKNLLVQRASEYLDLLAADAPDNAAVAEELATAHERLSEVRDVRDASSSGGASSAIEHGARAVAIRERLAAQEPGNVDRQRLLCLSLQNLVYLDTDLATGVGHARRAVEIADRLEGVRPPRAEIHAAVGGAHYMLGVALLEAADWAGALTHYQAAADAYDKQLALSPSDAQALRSRGLCNKRMGGLLLRSARWAEAVEKYTRALRVEEASVAARPDDALARRDVSVTRVDLSTAHAALGDLHQAEADLREAIRIRQELARADPQSKQAQIDVVSAERHMGELLVRQGKFMESLRVLDAAAAHGAELPPGQQDILVDILTNRAAAEALAGDHRSRVADARRALELNRRLFAQNPMPSRRLRDPQLALDLGDALVAAGRCADARSVYEDGLARALELEAENKLIGEGVGLPEKLRAAQRRCDGARGPAR